MRWTTLLWLCAGCGRIDFDPVDAVPGSSDVFLVAAHVNSSCAIIGGALSCWGDNARGQLLTGDQTDRFTPVRIGADGDWIAVAPGQNHICGVRQGGDLYCWGGGDQGQLGQGDFMDRSAPARVVLARPVTAVDAYFHTCAVLDDGELWCWGANLEGELGQNDAVNSPDISSPVQVSAATTWSRVSTGQGHTLATTTGGSLYGT